MFAQQLQKISQSNPKTPPLTLECCTHIVDNGDDDGEKWTRKRHQVLLIVRRRISDGGLLAKLTIVRGRDLALKRDFRHNQ